MTVDDNDKTNERSPDHEATLRDWKRPTLYRLTADSAEVTFAGVGADNGIYS